MVLQKRAVSPSVNADGSVCAKGLAPSGETDVNDGGENQAEAPPCSIAAVQHSIGTSILDRAKSARPMCKNQLQYEDNVHRTGHM